MPQESVGYPGMRVQEFMEYMAVLKGLSLKEPSVKEQILRLLRQVHLEEHMKKKFYKNNVGFIIFMVLVYLGIMIESCLRCEKILNKCQMIYEGSM